MLKEKYAKKAIHTGFATCYFLVSSIWGWSVLKDKPSLPWLIGGHGSFENFDVSKFFLPMDEAVYNYSLFTMGYHVQNGITHIFIDERMNDFQEMLLHHIAAFCLYFCYIFGNVHEVGATIAFLHDLADIPGNMCKCLNST